MKLFFPLIILALGANVCNAQTTITEEEGFINYLKVYKYEWPEFYAEYFDTYNYNQSKNDEFLKNKLIKTTSDLLHKKLSQITFKKKYTIVGEATLGEYNFNSNSFPISFDYYNQLNVVLNALSSPGLYISIENFINAGWFSWNLNISQEKASQFIQKRKNERGDVNRKVYLKFTYSICNIPINNGGANNYTHNALSAYIYSIDVLPNKNSDQDKLATLLPSSQFYDPANGIISTNGMQTTYWDKNWKHVYEKRNASYYSVVNFINGTINNPCTYYYISGQIEGKGNLVSTWPNVVSLDGAWTFYYETGGKQQESIYVNQLYNGPYRSWWENGNKREEVSYINGKKDGCDFEWDENGARSINSAFGGSYAPYYENGHEVYSSKNCSY